MLDMKTERNIHNLGMKFPDAVFINGYKYIKVLQKDKISNDIIKSYIRKEYVKKHEIHCQKIYSLDQKRRERTLFVLGV